MIPPMKKIFTVLALGAGLAFAGSAVAQQMDPTQTAIGARKSMMRLFAFNLGTLGAMAQGKMDYDASAAQTAASNLALLSKVNLAPMFPAGSDNASAEGTKALPAIWQNMADVGTKHDALTTAAAAMDAAAGNGLEALQGAMGPLGGACGSCHKAYRAE